MKDVESPLQRLSFRDIFDSELGFVGNVLRRFGVVERDLDDVAHEVFVVVHRRMTDFDPSRPLRPWLFGIAFRCASDYRRRAHRTRETLTDEEVEREDPAKRADESLIDHQERCLARHALLGVPEERRAVLVLHDLEDVPMVEIAHGLGIPLKTAYSRLRVGREELVATARRLRKEDT